MIKNINFLFVTVFGIGTFRYAPGTIASLITTTFLFSLFNVIKISSTTILIGLLLIFFYAFYAVATYIKNNSDKDPKEIVIDEVIGQSIPIYLYEITHFTNNNFQESILLYCYIFILFRFFDIKKPFPVNYFDRKFKNSFGVIFDDVIAGFYVVVTLVIFIFIKSKLFT